ncbi:MAG: DNA mismatch repair endonuclease MutL [Clostridiales bacterium]|nr:DNA mismatch repair endonuclease MutL [Clostridiales bacterium]
MSVINILDKKVYAQIAAGEVVERPSSVIKELVENSIDAGATKIKINIFGGGKDVIEVSDNGSGILEEDLLKTIMPHATSKIKDVEDISNITTLGFRGEALASIASVSKLRITTKTKGAEIGYTMEVSGGENPVIFDAPANEGTFVTVSNLFYNVPARQKFLKTVRSEENDVTDMVSRLMLANPNVSFRYEINDSLIFNSYGDGIEDAIRGVYGNKFIDQFIRVSNYKHGVKIEGYVGRINYTKPNRSYQTVILNGRCIHNQTIQSAIMNAYAGYLMKRKYPMVVLYITVPNEVVDVNVTPNKSDVRFIDNSVIYGAVYSTVSSVLDGSDVALDIILPTYDRILKSPEQVRKEALNPPEEPEVFLVTSRGNNNPNTSDYTYDKHYDPFENFKLVMEDENKHGDVSQGQTKPKNDDIFAENKRYIEELERKKEIEYVPQVEEKLKYVAQVLNSFLIFERGSDVYFIDQHAAHERILYNKLLYQRTVKEFPTQPLLVPYQLTVNSVEREYILDKLVFIKEMGFVIEQNTDGNFDIYEIPLELVDINLDDFFEDIFYDYSLRRETIPEVINEKLMQKACKSAVKAGMPLSDSEVESLMILLNGNINLKCPHGRPIAVRITRNEIDKWFKRVL